MRVENEELLSIGRFSQVTGLTAKALRHYDEVGLLRPAHVDEWTGYRWYSLEQAREAEAIRRLRTFEVPLDEIAVVVRADAAALRELLIVHRARLEGRAVETKRILEQLDRLIHGEEELVSQELLELKIEVVPEAVYAVIRQEAVLDDLPRVIPQLIGTVGEWAFANDRVAGAPVCICPMDEDGTFDLKVGWPVGAEASPPEPIVMFTCPATRAVVHQHVGPYTELHDTYRMLWEALEAQGIQPTGEPREVYETNPEEEPDLSKHVTTIIWPVD